MRQRDGATQRFDPPRELDDLRCDTRHLGDHDHRRAAPRAEHVPCLALEGEGRLLESVEHVVAHGGGNLLRRTRTLCAVGSPSLTPTSYVVLGLVGAFGPCTSYDMKRF